MTTCLLCTSNAVADGLCVEDGARLWAANVVIADPSIARKMYGAKVVSHGPRTGEWQARFDALGEIDTPAKATAFLARLDAARAERDAKTCGRPGCRKCLEER